ncbi:hypothetical protein N9937_01215 [bacterium]|nr:hypothetical protein [bacterium]
MTRQCNNPTEATEFSGWLRKQKEIDSGLGFVTTNLDYMWRNYKTRQFMFIEEKRYGCIPAFPQTKDFQMLDKMALDSRYSKNYCGFWVLVFEKTSPEDGWIELTRLNAKHPQRVSIQQLIRFLMFEDWRSPHAGDVLYRGQIALL